MTQGSPEIQHPVIPERIEKMCKAAHAAGLEAVYVSVADYEKLSSIYSNMREERVNVRSVAKTFYTDMRLNDIRILWHHGLPNLL